MAPDPDPPRPSDLPIINVCLTLIPFIGKPPTFSNILTEIYSNLETEIILWGPG